MIIIAPVRRLIFPAIIYIIREQLQWCYKTKHYVYMHIWVEIAILVCVCTHIHMCIMYPLWLSVKSKQNIACPFVCVGVCVEIVLSVTRFSGYNARISFSLPLSACLFVTLRCSLVWKIKPHRVSDFSSFPFLADDTDRYTLRKFSNTLEKENSAICQRCDELYQLPLQ